MLRRSNTSKRQGTETSFAKLLILPERASVPSTSLSSFERRLASFNSNTKLRYWYSATHVCMRCEGCTDFPWSRIVPLERHRLLLERLINTWFSEADSIVSRPGVSWRSFRKRVELGAKRFDGFHHRLERLWNSGLQAQLPRGLFVERMTMHGSRRGNSAPKSDSNVLFALANFPCDIDLGSDHSGEWKSEL